MRVAVSVVAGALAGGLYAYTEYINKNAAADATRELLAHLNIPQTPVGEEITQEMTASVYALKCWDNLSVFEKIITSPPELSERLKAAGSVSATADVPVATVTSRVVKPSNSVVYVSNLPFSMTDQELSDIFVNAGVNPVSAHVAVRRDGRSKGFGFVSFASMSDQVKALGADGSTVGDRVIVVKIAISDAPGVAPRLSEEEKAATGASFLGQRPDNEVAPMSETEKEVNDIGFRSSSDSDSETF